MLQNPANWYELVEQEDSKRKVQNVKPIVARKYTPRESSSRVKTIATELDHAFIIGAQYKSPTFLQGRAIKLEPMHEATAGSAHTETSHDASSLSRTTPKRPSTLLQKPPEPPSSKPAKKLFLPELHFEQLPSSSHYETQSARSASARKPQQVSQSVPTSARTSYDPYKEYYSELMKMDMNYLSEIRKKMPSDLQASVENVVILKRQLRNNYRDFIPHAAKMITPYRHQRLSTITKAKQLHHQQKPVAPL